MTSTTKQAQAWSSDFGREYTDRNLMTTNEVDALYVLRYGVSRSAMNKEFISKLDRNTRILEVGCNIGLQLEFLQKMGFRNLYGVEISPYAVRLARERTKDIVILQGDASDSIPFEDNSFDLVFTSGVLIHIPPDSLWKVMLEIHRCAKRYIWGLEYYSPEHERADYRKSGSVGDLLWRGDFSSMYRESFDDLFTVTEKFYQNKDNSDNVDTMFLLEKRTEKMI